MASFEKHLLEFKSGAIARENVFESEVFFNQDILRWSINEICFTQPKESVTKWLRLKNIFSSSNQERLQEKMFLSQKNHRYLYKVKACFGGFSLRYF